MKTFLGVPIAVEGRVFGNLYLTEKREGAAFTVEDQDAVVDLAGAAGYVIGNARAYGLSERRRRWLEATGRVAETLQPPVVLDAALADVTRILRAVSGARAVGVVARDPEGAVEVTALDGPEPEAVHALVAEHGAQLFPADEAADLPPLSMDGMPRWAVVLPVGSVLSETSALVLIFDSEDPMSDVQERQLMASFADHVGLAIDRARAVKDREELAILSDRDRIGRDLHDLVIQRLFATGMHLQGLGMRVDRDEFVEAIDKAVDDIDITIKEIRGTIFELHRRHDGSLRGEVRKLVKEYVPTLGFTPSVRTVGPIDTAVPADAQVELLAVLREALSNVTKHAHATHVTVEVAVERGDVLLRVSDDGIGLPQDRQGSGLRNARSRAAALGGSFEVTPAAPRGTVLVWRAPLS